MLVKKGTYVDTVISTLRDSKEETKKLEEKVQSFGEDEKGNYNLKAVMFAIPEDKESKKSEDN